MRLSIIVPIYNVEQYIEECLDSIYNQDLINFEVLCIVMQIWADNKRYFALDEFKKHLTDVGKQIIKLELAYRE